MTQSGQNKTLEKVLLISHLGMNIYLFRRTLIKSLLGAGVKIFVAVPEDEYTGAIKELGVHIRHYALARGSLNPLKMPESIRAIREIIYTTSPDMIHSFTHQPNILARLAAPRNAPLVNSITGLGSCFLKPGIRGRIKSGLFHLLYRKTAGSCRALIFQNKDDYGYFTSHRLTGKAKLSLIPGSGVDLSKFAPENFPNELIAAARSGLGIKPENTVVTMAARLIRDKGVFEFVCAAEGLAERFPLARFLLVGEPDPGNPNSLKPKAIKAAKKAGNVIFAGWRDDMSLLWALSDIAALPSYREGLPVSLQEALASGLPVVTTDAPGCREIVDPEKNGYLVPVRHVGALEDALALLLESPTQRAAFGKASRSKAEEEFNADFLAERIIALYRRIISGTWE
ncbi:MAG: glycosyltransferase family 4 protein [Thermodesulfobacteriota bacterium]|nr:glycosyltransferase family 4 protein [Thermodesulfobacteriota bacterium]